MARKYIGKRYIPKVDGEWNILTAYESLTIVTHEHVGYISKIDVPVGVELNNSKYWVQIIPTLGSGTEVITSSVPPVGHIVGRVWVNTL